MNPQPDQSKKKVTPPDVQVCNKRGQYVPATPKPLYVGWRLKKCQCDCGEVFKNEREYRSHYAYVHILGMEQPDEV